MFQKKRFTLLAALLVPALLQAAPAEAAKRTKRRTAKRAKITGKANLNTAKVAQLRLLPRIGTKTARAIVAYRVVKRFNTIGEVMQVKGIGKRTFVHLKSHLTVRGPNTIRKLKSKKKRRKKSRRLRKGRCRCKCNS